MPALTIKLPLSPFKLSFLKITLIIPAVPSAPYLAEGEVITSTLSIDSAGRFCSPCGPDIPTSPEGLPLIRILTFSFPLRDTLPSKSTDTEGTFPKTSATFPPLTVRSLPTL